MKPNRLIIIKNISQLVTMEGKGIEGNSESFLGIIENASVVIKGQWIIWAGRESEIPPDFLSGDAEIIDAEKKAVVPGFVDSHTHLVFAGSRADEYEMRCFGMTYSEIALKNGGIMKTVNAVRNESEEILTISALERMKTALQNGVTTIEIKSGYGLDLENELKLLRVIKKIAKIQPVRVVPTFLAHIIPPEFRKNRSEYIDDICSRWLPEITKLNLAKFCDVFCDSIAFTKPEAEKILKKALELGLNIKVHADQIERTEGALLASFLSACSADHLDMSDENDLDVMKNAGVVGVLLPGCAVSMCKPVFPHASKYRKLGKYFAFSTDFNPGSSSTQNISLVGTLACSFGGFTPAEALWGITMGGAMALRSDNLAGSIREGKRSDIIVTNVSDYREIFSYFGNSPCRIVFVSGEKYVIRD
jgi:imidazolonepropionase